VAGRLSIDWPGKMASNISVIHTSMRLNGEVAIRSPKKEEPRAELRLA
jgi:hypothetical protein